MSRKYHQTILDITEYVYHYEITDEEALQAARVALLDALGCAIETNTKSDECRRLLGPVVPGTMTPGGARVPGTALELDPIKAAFDIGALTRYLDHNDALGGAEWGHPSDNLAGILAVADWLDRSSSRGLLKHTGSPLTVRTILEALIKAYEIQGCYQMKNAFNVHGLDHVILVKLSVVAVCSWLAGLTEEQAHAALSHVWMDGIPSRVYRQSADTIPRKGWAAADASMRAVQLVLMVKSGQPGSPGALDAWPCGFLQRHKFGAAATAGGESSFDLPKPFGTWVVRNVFFKLMPVEGHGIAATEAALLLRPIILARGPLSSISELRIATTSAACRIISKQGPPHNSADRDHCLQYVVALALVKGAYPETQDYADDSRYATSEEIDSLRSKMVVVEDKQLTRDYLDVNIRSAGARLRVTLQDGSQLDEVLVEFPPGHARHAQTQRLVRNKFRRNMRHAFQDGEIDAIERAIQSDDESVGTFMGRCVRPGPFARL
jgi:2-methylcitrate dehydratase